jgi:hypothetical protein
MNNQIIHVTFTESETAYRVTTRNEARRDTLLCVKDADDLEFWNKNIGADRLQFVEHITEDDPLEYEYPGYDVYKIVS